MKIFSNARNNNDSESQHREQSSHVSDNVTILDVHFFKFVLHKHTSCGAQLTIGNYMECAPNKAVYMIVMVICLPIS